MNKTIALKTVSLIFVLCIFQSIAYGQEQTAKEEEIRLLKERIEELEKKVKAEEPLRNKSEQSQMDSKFDSLYQKYKNKYTLMKGKYIGPFDFGLSVPKALDQTRCQDLTRWAVGEYGTVKNWKVLQIVASDEMLALGEGTDTEAKLVLIQV
jgi:hypothetical protein